MTTTTHHVSIAPRRAMLPRSEYQFAQARRAYAFKFFTKFSSRFRPFSMFARLVA